MRLFVAVLFALFSFVCGVQKKNEAVLNIETDNEEPSVDYETLIRILDEDFPETDPDTLDCTDILSIYLEWTNTDDQRAGYELKLGKVQKVRRATRKRTWPKERKMSHEIREHHLARLQPTERQRKITSRLRACGCWVRQRGKARIPSKSTSVSESVITATRKLKPHIAPKQKSTAENPNVKSPPAHLKSKLSDLSAKNIYNPNSLEQVVETPAVRSRVPPPLQGRLHHLQQKPGSLVKETLQALNRHGKQLDAQFANAFAQTLGVEHTNSGMDNFNDKDEFDKSVWNKNEQSQSGRFIAKPVGVNEKLHAIKDGTLDRVTHPLAEKFHDKEEDIDTDPASIKESRNDYWYIILIGCLLGVCALLAVSLVVVLCRRRRNKRMTDDDIDCKFDTGFKEPTVYVSVTSGSLSKQNMSSEKTTDKQCDQDIDTATYDTKVNAIVNDNYDGVEDVSCTNGNNISPDYENVIVPPAYHEVVIAEKRFEQHV